MAHHLDSSVPRRQRAPAFAFAYACVCLKLGALLPHADTILDQMLANPAQCNGPLHVADESIKANPKGRPDLSQLKHYYDQLLLKQIQAAQSMQAIAPAQ